MNLTLCLFLSFFQVQNQFLKLFNYRHRLGYKILYMDNAANFEYYVLFGQLFYFRKYYFKSDSEM